MADTSPSKRWGLCPCFPPLDSEQALWPILTREYGGPGCASCGFSPETPGTSTLMPGEPSCCLESDCWDHHAGRALRRATQRPQRGNACPWPRARAQAWTDGRSQLLQPVPRSLGHSCWAPVIAGLWLRFLTSDHWGHLPQSGGPLKSLCVLVCGRTCHPGSAPQHLGYCRSTSGPGIWLHRSSRVLLQDYLGHFWSSTFYSMF